MSRLCSSKAQNQNLMKNAKEKLFTNCNFKLHYSPVQSLDDGLSRREQQYKKSEEIHKGNGFFKGKQKFQCHYEEGKIRAEIKRKNLIQKLRTVYKIDVKDFNEDVINEIIMKVKLLESQKKERKQRSMERTITMVTRLLKEQKYKMRQTKVEYVPLKTLKNLEINKDIRTKTDDSEENESGTAKAITLETCQKNQLQQSEDKDADSISPSIEEQKGEEEQQKRPLTCLEIIKSKKRNQPQTPKIFIRQPPPCVSLEKYLECYPKRIVFKNYEKGKVYLQNLRITNVGIEVIHCRYLGILVHTKGEGKFPIGVAVRDNVKLRPGLSCSTKLRLCSPDDNYEMECSIVYETRRQKKCFEYSWFFVPVVCIPARANVKVTPVRIIFPALTWCAATRSEGSNFLKKNLKIENTGGKACFCRISDESLKPALDEIFGEAQREEESVLVTIADSEFSEGGKSPSNEGEFCGEYYFFPLRGEETAKLLVNELIENVFETFRFSKKYCIEIPPFSVQHIEVRFIPKYKGFHHEMKYIQFEGCYNLEEQNIELMGDIKQIPLKVEPQMIDMKTCIINSGVYAGIFHVLNCSKGPYRIKLKIPSSLKNHALVKPQAAIIQPLQSCVFSVRIYPRVTLSNDAFQYFDRESGILEFPVRVHPANVGDCKLDHIKLYVHALITTFDLELSPPIINFGTVSTLETVRTKLEVTNHSLAMQEYGFLNLPKGIRVEPNMGFGKILPKETVPLYLIYSPTADLFEKVSEEEKVEFNVIITSITKYGGLKEKLEQEEYFQEPEWMGEDYQYEFPELMQEFSGENSEKVPSHEESEESDLCDDDFSIEGEELISKIQFQENKIRSFLKKEAVEKSDNSVINLISQNEPHKKHYVQDRDALSVIGECEEDEKFKAVRPNMNVIKCRANVIGPRCQISETVIQLPATPFNSFSLYRFQLNGMSETTNASCTCGLKNARKSCSGKPKYKAAFEFQHSHSQIKLEPGSGYLKAGDSLPITIISRPDVGLSELYGEQKIKKASDNLKFKHDKKERLISKSNTSLKLLNEKKNHEVTSKGNKKSQEMSRGIALEEVMSASLSQLKPSDMFLGENPVSEMTESGFFEAKVRCIIKTWSCEDQSEMTEIHDMLLICPAIRKHFIYLSRSQEINFGKVFIGTRSQIILQVQNVCFERISPSVTLLNPAGPFICPGSFYKLEIDPEHVWRQPLSFVPEEPVEVDQFFEIYFGPTSVFLKVVGEAVEPQYSLLPTFGCCLLEARINGFEEIKLEIHNQSPVELFLHLDTVFVRDGFDLQLEDVEAEGVSGAKVKPERKEGSKDKKKSKNTESERKKYRIWETTPEFIISNLEYFMDSLGDSVFTLVGVDENNSFAVPPFEANQIKIQFWPPPDRSDKKYAVKYNLMLGKSILLREIIILGKVSK